MGMTGYAVTVMCTTGLAGPFGPLVLAAAGGQLASHAMAWALREVCVLSYDPFCA